MAILFTDVAGYTALTERDETTAVRVRERHRTLVIGRPCSETRARSRVP